MYLLELKWIIYAYHLIFKIEIHVLFHYYAVDICHSICIYSIMLCLTHYSVNTLGVQLTKNESSQHMMDYQRAKANKLHNVVPNKQLFTMLVDFD